MSEWAVARRAGAVVLLLVAMGPLAAHASDAANVIAERFAADGDGSAPRQSQARDRQQAQRAAEDARRAAEQRRADEADMLARARREAEEMRAAEERAQLVEEARRLIIEAEAARANAEALLQRRREQATEEKSRRASTPNGEAARRAAAEAEARRTTRQAAERERALAWEDARSAQTRREETRRAVKSFNFVRKVRSARIATQERRLTQAERQMQKAPTERSAPGADLGRPRVDEIESADRTEVRSVGSGTTTSEPTMALGGRDREDDETTETYADHRMEERFTVLLVMAPGNYGIRRRGPKVADPILCAPDGCFVSNGADEPARFLRGRKALGFFNTVGRRAGACRRQLGCVFRGVQLDRFPDYLQPVDLHILRHDRRRPHEILGDSRCRMEGDRLVCRRGIYAETYAMWIVPERVAEEAGPDALERAVAELLRGSRSADIFTLLGR
jgi:hypothetical protein